MKTNDTSIATTKASNVKVRVNQTRRALHIIKVFGDRSFDSLSDSERKKYQDSINILRNDEFSRPSNNFDITNLKGRNDNTKPGTSDAANKRGKQTKRVRSTEDPSIEGKKPRDNSFQNPETVTVRDVVRNLLHVCIIDNGDPEGKINETHWKLLQETITGIIIKQCLDKPNIPAPRFCRGGWIKGFRVTECRDQWSLDFLRAQVALLGELWMGADLDVVHKNDIPSKPRALIWLPHVGDSIPRPTKEEVQMVLRMQNPEINKDDIIVVRPAVSEKPFGMSFIIELGATGVSAIKNGTPDSLNFGMSDVPVHFLASYTKDQLTLPTDTEEPSAVNMDCEFETSTHGTGDPPSTKKNSEQ